MPYQVMFRQLAFQPVELDNPTVPSGPEEIIQRGGLVPDYVSLFQISALESAGMIVAVSAPNPAVVPDNTLPPQVRTPDMPPVLPSDPNGVPPLLRDLPSGDVVVDNPNAGPTANNPTPVVTQDPLPPLPQTSDKKEVWEQYATRPQIGMSEGEAEGMNKTDLIAEVRRRAEGQ